MEYTYHRDVTQRPCGSGRAREAGDAVDGTGYAGVRGLARSHRGPALKSKNADTWVSALGHAR